jgi:beta-glucosidase
MKCVVLLVSGRPMNITSIQGEANAIVESWLPGSEGEGVADTLFGKSPFTGRLPDTWAKQVDTTTTPVDVGIPSTTGTYDPLYPYGWGLRTDSAKARVTAVRDALAKQSDPASRLATLELSVLLTVPGAFNANGSVHNSALAVALIALASPAVSGTSSAAEQNANLLVSVVRDLAQNAIVSGGATAMSKTAALTADAEHSLMSGKPTSAVAGLTKAWLLAQGH